MQIEAFLQILDITSSRMKENITKKEINYIINQNLKDVYSISIKKKSYLAYNKILRVKPMIYWL